MPPVAARLDLAACVWFRHAGQAHKSLAELGVEWEVDGGVSI